MVIWYRKGEGLCFFVHSWKLSLASLGTRCSWSLLFPGKVQLEWCCGKYGTRFSTSGLLCSEPSASHILVLKKKITSLTNGPTDLLYYFNLPLTFEIYWLVSQSVQKELIKRCT